MIYLIGFIVVIYTIYNYVIGTQLVEVLRLIKRGMNDVTDEVIDLRRRMLSAEAEIEILKEKIKRYEKENLS